MSFLLAFLFLFLLRFLDSWRQVKQFKWLGALEEQTTLKFFSGDEGNINMRWFFPHVVKWLDPCFLGSHQTRHLPSYPVVNMNQIGLRRRRRRFQARQAREVIYVMLKSGGNLGMFGYGAIEIKKCQQVLMTV